MLEIFDHGDIREIRLARPPVNALDLTLIEALRRAIDDAADRAALVISGREGLFSAGLDVPAILARDTAGMAEVFAALWQAQRAIALSPRPVVFALTGHCPAGGTVLALHADYRVMAAGDFVIGLNEVQVGLYPGPVIAGAFRRLVGGHAAQLLTRGALIDPATALRVGLVDEIGAPAQCVARALDVAREFGALPGEAMRQTRELVRSDLVALFGPVAEAEDRAREFGAQGARMFSEPATRARLQKMFARK